MNLSFLATYPVIFLVVGLVVAIFVFLAVYDAINEWRKP